MSSDSDDLVKRAVEKFATRVEQDSNRRKLNGIANGAKEQQRVAFLVKYAEKVHAVIKPAFARAVEQVNSLSQRLSRDAEAAKRAVQADIIDSDDEDQITLKLERKSQEANLVFTADPLRMRVTVTSTDGRVNTSLV